MTTHKFLLPSRLIVSLGALAAMALSAPSASATVAYTWIGSTTNWSTASNWLPAGGPPTSADIVSLPAAATANMPTLTAAGNASQVVFFSSTGGWSINGGSGFSLTIQTTINAVTTTSGMDSFNVSINPAHTATWSIGTGGTLAFNDPIGNNTALTQSGGGTVLFGSNNSWNGTYTVSAGNMIIAADNVFNTGAAGVMETVNWNSGGTLAVSGSHAAVANFNINSGIKFSGTLSQSGTMQLSGTGQVSGQQTITLANNSAWNISSTVINQTGTSGGLSLTAAAGATAATFTLSGANTFTGGITTGSNVVLNSNNNSALGSGTLTLAAGSTLGNTSGAAITNTNAISVTGNASINTSSGITESGIISGAGGVTLGGTGTVTLAGANTYTGATLANAGTLLIRGSLSGSTAVTVAAGSTIGVGKAAGAAGFGTLNVTSLQLTGSSAFSTLKLTMGNSGASDSFVTSGSMSITGGGTINLALTLDSGVSDLSGNYILLTWGTGNVITPGQIDLAGSSAQILTDISNSSYSLQNVGSSLELVAAVPEPASVAMLMAGGAVLGLMAWKRGAKGAAMSRTV